MRQLTITLAVLLYLASFGQTSPENLFKNYDGIKYIYPDKMTGTMHTQPKEDTVDNSLNYKPGELQLIAKLDSSKVYIYLINASDSTIVIEVQDGSIPMIREALNDIGKWQPIEYWTWSDCGNSYYTNNLQPMHQYSMNSFLFGGPFKTKIRFKMLLNNCVLYSNSYKGQINKKQFEKRELGFNQSFLEKK